MADKTVFLEDLLLVEAGDQRTYELREVVAGGLACIDARLRRGTDWYFGRKWVRAAPGRRELYRWIDRVEARGFRFRLLPRAPQYVRPPPEDELLVRASDLRAALSGAERRIHAELFPDEVRLLERGYDWDARRVYRGGAALRADPWGRLLEADEGILYEWVRIEDERTWRRYPLERVREDEVRAAESRQPSV